MSGGYFILLQTGWFRKGLHYLSYSDDGKLCETYLVKVSHIFHLSILENLYETYLETWFNCDGTLGLDVMKLKVKQLRPRKNNK